MLFGQYTMSEGMHYIEQRQLEAILEIDGARWMDEATQVFTTTPIRFGFTMYPTDNPAKDYPLTWLAY